MLSALLAGAGLVGVIDVLLSPELASSPLRREVLLVVLGGNLLGAAAIYCALRPLIRLRRGPAFALGAGLALAPLLSQALGDPWLGISASCALAVAAAGIASNLALPAGLTRATAGLTLSGFALVAALPSTLSPSLPSLAPHEGRADRPDLLLISVDTLRADAISDPECTPHMSRLRARGLRADFALAPSSLTLPSHVSLLSGLRIDEHGVSDNHGVIDHSLAWISERLHGAGYRTAAVVSNYLVRGDAGFARGFEVYDEAPVAHAGPVSNFRSRVARATWWGWVLGDLPAAADVVLYADPIPRDRPDRGNARRTTDHALRLMRQLQEDPAPFYLFVHYMDPHAPYVAPTPGCGPTPTLPAKYAGPETDWRFLQRVARDLRSGAPAAEAARKHVAALYAAEVQYLDRMLGELLGAVEKRGRPTVVLLTADHGEQFGDHGLMAHGDSVYEAALRVPFLLAGPGVPERRLDEPPHLVDVAPTLLGLAGLPVAGLPGLDLSRRVPPPRAHLARAGPHAALRDERGWKSIVKLDRPGSRLYDVGRDPGESRDLRSARPELAASLERRLRERTSTATEPSLDHSEEHLSALRALGYVGD